MSGRPLTPNWTVLPFAPDANYAVGALPWEGQPTKTVWAGAASVGFTPKLGVPAQAINNLFNSHADALIKIRTWADAIESRIGQYEALNFPGNSGAAFATAAKFAYFVPKSRMWVVLGLAGLNKATHDMGATWDSPDPAGTEDYLGGDSNANGVMVWCTKSRNVTVGDYEASVTGTLTGDYDCFGTALTSVYNSCVVYEATSGLWCCVTCTSATGLLVRTSTTGNTWTARTGPSGWANGKMRLIRKPSGRLVIVGLQAAGGNIVKTSHSDDGGITWTAATTLDLTATTMGGTDVYLAYDAEKDRWLLTLSSRSASSYTFASTNDGATWTFLSSLLTNASLENPAPLGGSFWVATCSEHIHGSPTLDRSVVVYSLDDGLTWKYSGFVVSVINAGAATSVGAYVALGGVLVLANERAFLGPRQGEPGLGGPA